MASEILNGNDFFIKGNAQIDGNGDLVVENEFNEDYSFAIASRDIFAMSGGNKSVRFLFSASPYKSQTLSSKQSSASANRFAFVSGTGKATVLGNIDSSYNVEATVLNANSVSVSNTHSIVLKDDGTAVGYGDNTNGQLDLSGIHDIKDMAAGDGFTAILLIDGSITILGSSAGNVITVPESVSTFDSQDMPISIDAGLNFIAVSRKDATVSAWGNEDSDQLNIPTFNEPVVGISCGDLYTLAITVEGSVIGWGDDTYGQIADIPNSAFGAQYIKAGPTRAVAISTAGFTSSWGQGVSTAMEANATDSTVAILSSPGDGFTLTSGRDGSISLVGTLPQAISDISETVGNQRSLDIQKEEYENHPMLKQTDVMNIIFGIQNEDAGPEFDKAVSQDGTVLPIIVGKNGDSNVFKSLSGAIKGGILAKTTENKDVCYELSGTEFDPFTFSGHRPVAEAFVTNNNEERYEAIVTFSPFGKALKFRKLSGSYANEMPYTVIDLNNVPYERSRVVLYIRGAQDFQLHYAEVTDEIDAALLPAEALFRDTDTAILQTRAAQSMVDIMETMKSLDSTLASTASTLIEMGSNHKSKITELQDRIVALGG